MNLKVAIITVVKNNREFIETAIKSVLSQSYADIEYIIIDGASNDGTTEVIKKYAGKVSKWISEPDNGIYDALNKGLRMTSGDVVAFLNSDDFFTDEFVIERIVRTFAIENADAVYSDIVYVSQKNPIKIKRYWKAGKYSPKSLKYGWMPPHPSLFVRKKLYEKAGFFDTSLKIASDYDMVLRLLKNCTSPISYINEVLVKMRLGGKSNLSLKNIFLKSKEDYSIIKNNNFSFPIMTLFLKNIRKVSQFFNK